MTRYVCLIFFLVCSAPAFADTRLPNTSYALQSEDGDRVLVMLLAHNPSPASINGVVYPRSGLYKVGDPPELVWEFGGYLSSVLLSKDGQYLVRPGLWKPHCQRCSVEFYKNGNKLREYLTHELVKDRSSVSRDRWGRPRWKKASRFYSEKTITSSKRSTKTCMCLTSSVVKSSANALNTSRIMQLCLGNL